MRAQVWSPRRARAITALRATRALKWRLHHDAMQRWSEWRPDHLSAKGRASRNHRSVSEHRRQRATVVPSTASRIALNMNDHVAADLDTAAKGGSFVERATGRASNLLGTTSRRCPRGTSAMICCSSVNFCRCDVMCTVVMLLLGPENNRAVRRALLSEAASLATQLPTPLHTHTRS